MSSTHWTVEVLYNEGVSFLVNPNGIRMAKMSHARARGIAAALNTPKGKAAFDKATNS